MCTIIYAVAIGASFQSEWIPSADRTERQQISTSCAHADPACLRRAPDPMPGPVRIVPELWSTWPSLDIIMITPRATNGGWAPDNQGTQGTYRRWRWSWYPWVAGPPRWLFLVSLGQGGRMLLTARPSVRPRKAEEHLAEWPRGLVEPP